MMQQDVPEPTFMNTLRFYRDLFVKLWRLCARFPSAQRRTKIIVSISVLLCAGLIAGGIALLDEGRRKVAHDYVAENMPFLLGEQEEEIEKPLAPMPRDPAREKSIAAGVSNRMAYVDGYHSAVPSSLLFLKDMGITGFDFREDFVTNKRDLMNSGVLVMGYQQKKPPLTDEEYELIRSYIANGGRLLLMCPAWVYPQYEKKPLDTLMYNRIGRDLGFFMDKRYASKPLKVVHKWFAAEGIESLLKGAFSNIRSDNAHPVLVGKNGEVAAVAVEKGKCRAFVWAQNDLMNPQVAGTPAGGKLCRSIFEWLLDDSVDLSDGTLGSPSFASQVNPGGTPLSSEATDALLTKSIAAGVSNRVVYLNTYNGVPPGDMKLLKEAGLKVNEFGYQGILYNQDELFNSGLLVMIYGMNKKVPTAAEYAILKKYIANGGRLLLACPAWVWDAYEKKPMEELPYNILAGEFGLVMDTAYIKAPLRSFDPRWKFNGSEKKIGGTFSAIGYTPQNATPILMGADNRAAAVTATRGDARLVLWAQDNLLTEKVAGVPANRKVILQMVEWLLE